jgi:hypothetical protein
MFFHIGRSAQEHRRIAGHVHEKADEQIASILMSNMASQKTKRILRNRVEYSP